MRVVREVAEGASVTRKVLILASGSGYYQSPRRSSGTLLSPAPQDHAMNESTVRESETSVSVALFGSRSAYPDSTCSASDLHQFARNLFGIFTPSPWPSKSLSVQQLSVSAFVPDRPHKLFHPPSVFILHCHRCVAIECFMTTTELRKGLQYRNLATNGLEYLRGPIPTDAEPWPDASFHTPTHTLMPHLLPLFAVHTFRQLVPP